MKINLFYEKKNLYMDSKNYVFKELKFSNNCIRAIKKIMKNPMYIT